MNDFISDAEMEQLERKQPIKKQAVSEVNDAPDFISDEEMQAINPAPAVQEEQGIGSYLVDKALSGIGYVGSKIDSVTGAPARTAVRTLQEDATDIGGALSNAWEQFGADPSKAPTGKDIASKAGLSTRPMSELAPELYSDTGEGLALQKGGMLDFSSAGAAGLGTDIAIDPLNVVGLGTIAKGVGKVASVGGDIATGAAKIGTKVAGGAADVITGTKVGTKTAEVASRVGDKVVDAAGTVKSLFKPRVAKGFERLKQTATKLGIDPKDLSATAEFDSVSTPAFLERSLREGPTGEKLMQKFTDVANRIQEAAGTAVDDLAGGLAGGAMAAGDAIKSGYKRAEDALFSKNFLTYKKAAQLTPDMQLSEKGAMKLASALNGMEKRAKGLIAYGTPAEKAIGKELLDYAGSVRLNNNYKKLSERIGYIGKSMTNEANDLLLRKELRNLYSEVSDTLVDSVREIHPELADDLLEGNRQMSAFFKERDALGKLIQQEASSPEKVFKAIAGDSSKIESLKKLLQPEELKAFRGSYLNNLISKNADGQIIYASTIKNLNKNKEMLSKLFSKQELQEFTDILELGKAQGIPVLSTSGTGMSAKFGDLLTSIPRGLVGEEVLEGLKASGRSTSNMASSPLGQVVNDVAGVVPEAQQSLPPNLLQSIGNKASAIPEAIGNRINQRAIPLKAAQVYSIQEYNNRPDLVSVPASLNMQILQAIDASQMSNVEKAISINKLNKDGKISVELFNKVTGGGF